MDARVVADAGPLIWLARGELLPILKRSYSSVLIPPAVRLETVDKGFEGNHSDAAIISRALNEGWIRVENPRKTRINQATDQAARMSIRLGTGEIEAIALALTRKTILLTNDEDARTVAKSLRLKVKGTPRILLDFVKQSYITKEEAREALRMMIDDGLWLTPTVVQLFNELLEHI